MLRKQQNTFDRVEMFSQKGFTKIKACTTFIWAPIEPAIFLKNFGLKNKIIQ